MAKAKAQVRLVVKKGGKTGQVMSMNKPQVVVGRGEDCAIRIPSIEVSRQHCRLSFDKGVLYVEDLDSVNGTYLNSVEVTEREAVQPGDRLEIGPITFEVRYRFQSPKKTPAPDPAKSDSYEFEILEDIEAEADTNADNDTKDNLEPDASIPFDLVDPENLRSVLSELEEDEQTDDVPAPKLRKKRKSKKRKSD